MWCCWNGIWFCISLSSCLLLVCRNKRKEFQLYYTPVTDIICMSIMIEKKKVSFRATPVVIWEFAGFGSNQSCSCWPTPQPATPDPSCTCDLHCSSWQHRTLNPLSEVRDWTWVLMVTSWVLNPLSHNRNSVEKNFNKKKKLALNIVTKDDLIALIT